MFEKKVCIVTGGANGIGRCICEEFSKRGACVAFIDIDKKAGEKLERRLAGSLFYHGNVGVRDHLLGFYKAVIEKFGKIDFLVNNCGISHKGIISNCTFEEFNEVLAVGVTAPYMLCSLFFDSFEKDGAIINIASTRASMSQQDTESYTAAKGALVSLTHALAVTFSGIATVNCISPGWIDTAAYHDGAHKTAHSIADKNQHPSKRVGTPEDIAQAVLFLCGRDSDFINGQNIIIDGGMSKLMVYNGDDGWTYDGR